VLDGIALQPATEQQWQMAEQVVANAVSRVTKRLETTGLKERYWIATWTAPTGKR